MTLERVQRPLFAVLAAGLLAGAVVGCGGANRSRGPTVVSASPPPRGPAAVTVSDHPIGRPIPSGFLGLSFEYQGTRHYTGVNPRAVNPVLVQLIRNLAPGQAPVLRIGGDSADASWWPIPGVRTPPWVKYTLTRSWLQTTAALTRELGARLILGINLTANRRAISGAEARALLAGIGRRHIAALEVGNEPEVYGQLPWYRANGHSVYARPRWYGTRGWRPTRGTSPPCARRSQPSRLPGRRRELAGSSPVSEVCSPRCPRSES